MTWPARHGCDADQCGQLAHVIADKTTARMGPLNSNPAVPARPPLRRGPCRYGGHLAPSLAALVAFPLRSRRCLRSLIVRRDPGVPIDFIAEQPVLRHSGKPLEHEWQDEIANGAGERPR